MPFRLLIGVVVVAMLGLGVYIFMPPKFEPATTASSATAASLKNPLGDALDPKDPGQQHYDQGRYPEAIVYWTQAAANGDADAAHRLGVEYMDGKPGVVQRDYAKALQYHRQAAVAGNPMSMFDVGTMYEYGDGVPKDLTQSAKWYGHAANYGLAQAQYNYATMLEAGEGMPKDEVEAYKFFILGARGGFTGVPYDNNKLRIDRDAPLPTQLLERKLSREQIADGRQRADSFKAATGPLKVE